MLTIEGNIITENGQARRRVEINDSGLISKVTDATGIADIVFKDELIFPGFIDLHVHAREDASHSQEYKEDFTTAGEAAINGGVVAFADMPNNVVSPIDDESYNVKNNLAKKSPVEVLLYAGIGPNTNPLDKNVPYKVFMGHSVGDLFFTTLSDLENSISKYEGQNVSFHCEDPEIMEISKDLPTHEMRRPASAEISAVDFALYLIEKYNIVGKICHCSTIEGIKKIVDAKKRGLKVRVEVTPHHLYFDESMIEENRTKFQVNPPIRQTKENRLALIEMLRAGDIDYLATDHAPHSIEEKEKGISGLTHLDTYGNFVSWLIVVHNFKPEEILKVCSTNPGNFLNIFMENKYGKIQEGYSGSLCMLNLNKPICITQNILKTKCKWSPFLGVTFPGNVVATIINGVIKKNEK